MFSLKKSKLRGDMVAVFQYMKGYHREDAIDLFSPAPEGKTRSNGWNLYSGRSKLEPKESFAKAINSGQPAF